MNAAAGLFLRRGLIEGIMSFVKIAEPLFG